MENKIGIIAFIVIMLSVCSFLSLSAAEKTISFSDAFIEYSGTSISEGISRCENSSYLILPETKLPFKFQELIPSWNIPAGKDEEYFVLIRSGNEDSMDFWTLAGEWNMETSIEDIEQALIESGVGGEIKNLFRSRYSKFASDYMVSDGSCDRFSMMFVFRSHNGADKVSRVCVALSDKRGDKGLPLYEFSPIKDPVSLELPFRSQGWEDPKIAGHVCSIVSTCTIMDFFGKNVKTAELAEICYDKRNDMYGMWWKACAGASLYGFKSDVRYFRTLDEAYSFIEQGIPIAACIAFDDDELTGSATIASDGHVIVIAGFDDKGNVICYDGAFRNKEDGIVCYKRNEFEKAWFVKGGGVGYLLRPCEKEK